MNDVIQAAVKRLEPKYKPRSDKEIITEIGLGDSSGDALFYLLFGRYAEMLEAIFRRQSSGRIEFDDFMLELDIRLFVNRCAAIISFDENKASFKTYLGTIAHNLLYDMSAKEMPTLDILEALRQADCGFDEYGMSILVDAINSYPNKDSRYVLLKTIEGYKSKEIAAMLTRRRQEEGTLDKGKSLTPAYIDTVRSRTLKAIRRMMAGPREQAESRGVSACPVALDMAEPFALAKASIPTLLEPEAASFTDITNPFITNIYILYNQMKEDYDE